MVIACFKVVSSPPSGTRAIRILVVVVARHAREGVAWTAEGHRDGGGGRSAYLRNRRTAHQHHGRNVRVADFYICLAEINLKPSAPRRAPTIVTTKPSHDRARGLCTLLY